jgi:site-specific recombinase XerD
MLTDYIFTPFALARHRSTPFGGYLDGFTEWLAERDYKTETIRVLVQNVTALGLWLHDDVAPQALDEEVLDRYGLHLRRIGRLKHPSGRYFTFASGPRLFLKYLRVIAVTAPARVELSPLVVEFGEWQRVHRGAVPETVAYYARHVQAMVAALGDPRRMTAAAIRTYLLRTADGRTRSYVTSVCVAIRGFLRFLIATGRCRVGLDAAVPVIARWHLAELPRFVHRADVRRIVAAADSDNAHGLRDRAILTLVAEMGLRAGDIGAITFDDIDLNARTLTVTGKNKVVTRLPMPASAVRAVCAYIKRGRPDVRRTAVFVGLAAPYVPVTPWMVFYIVQTAVRRSGVVAPHNGPHMLRHSFAVEALRRGLPVDAIGALMRHHSLDATLKYAKVDATRLQRLAVAWKEVAPC